MSTIEVNKLPFNRGLTLNNVRTAHAQAYGIRSGYQVYDSMALRPEVFRSMPDGSRIEMTPGEYYSVIGKPYFVRGGASRGDWIGCEGAMMMRVDGLDGDSALTFMAVAPIVRDNITVSKDGLVYPARVSMVMIDRLPEYTDGTLRILVIDQPSDADLFVLSQAVEKPIWLDVMSLFGADDISLAAFAAEMSIRKNLTFGLTSVAPKPDGSDSERLLSNSAIDEEEGDRDFRRGARWARKQIYAQLRPEVPQVLQIAVHYFALGVNKAPQVWNVPSLNNAG
jgi:hypothetical protein